MKLIKDLGMQYPRETSKERKRYGIYQCPNCMIGFKTQTANVKAGSVNQCRSCGSSTHKLSGHRLYSLWSSAKNRCMNPNDARFYDYGGRGISMSEEFMDFDVWFKYVMSLPDANEEGLEIDRIDNNKGYERNNIKWSNRCEQAQNTRLLPKSNTSGYRGLTKVVTKNGKERWRVALMNNCKMHRIAICDTALEGARAYDKYVIANNFKHPINGV